MHCMAMREAERSLEVLGEERERRAALSKRTVMFMVLNLTRLMCCLLYLRQAYRREKMDRWRKNRKAERCNDVL